MPNRLGWGADGLGCDRTFPTEAIGVGVRLKTEATGVGVEFPARVQPARASMSPHFALSQTEFIATKASAKLKGCSIG